MVPLIFDINAGELVILAVLAVVFFGPERIPEISRKAARIVFYLRNIANDATNQLKAELGPEYQDLTVEDLNPKTFVRKHLLDDMQSQVNGVRSDLDSVKAEFSSVNAGAVGVAAASHAVQNDNNGAVTASAVEAATTPGGTVNGFSGLHFDSEAT